MSAKTVLTKEYRQAPAVRPRPEMRLYDGQARPRRAEEQATARGTVFSPHLIVRALERESGRYQMLDVRCAPQVVQRWRAAILTQTNDSHEAVRRLLSGHHTNGAPLEEPHVAFMPLADVGQPHADGHLLGMGIILPQGLTAGVRRDALRAVSRVDRLLLGRLGSWRISEVSATEPAWNLRPDVWTAHPGGATHWATVTPIVFDRHPKAKDKGEYQRAVAGMIASSFTRIGLPEPREVIVTPVSAHLRVPPAHEFPRLRRKDGSERRHAHATVVFERPVCGPMLIGAGRYRGYGVCRPLNEGRWA